MELRPNRDADSFKLRNFEVDSVIGAAGACNQFISLTASEGKIQRLYKKNKTNSRN